MPELSNDEQLFELIHEAGQRRAHGRQSAKDAMADMDPIIRELLRRKASPSELSEASGLTRETIYQIKREVEARELLQAGMSPSVVAENVRLPVEKVYQIKREVDAENEG